MQETGITLQNIDGVRAAMRRLSVDITTGPLVATETRRIKKKGMTLREGAGSAKGGVAFVHTVPMTELIFDEKGAELGGEAEEEAGAGHCDAARTQELGERK